MEHKILYFGALLQFTHEHFVSGSSTVIFQEFESSIGENVEDAKFPWSDFFREYVIPELLPFSLAIIVSVTGLLCVEMLHSIIITFKMHRCI